MASKVQFALAVPAPMSRKAQAELQRDLRQEVVLGLFRRGLCSGGWAAKALGITFHDFLDLLKECDIPYAADSRAMDMAERRTLASLRAGTKQASNRI